MKLYKFQDLGICSVTFSNTHNIIIDSIQYCNTIYNYLRSRLDTLSI